MTHCDLVLVGEICRPPESNLVHDNVKKIYGDGGDTGGGNTGGAKFYLNKCAKKSHLADTMGVKGLTMTSRTSLAY